MWHDVKDLYNALRRHDINKESQLLQFYSWDNSVLTSGIPCVCGKTMVKHTMKSYYVKMRCKTCEKTTRMHILKNTLGSSMHNFEMIRFLFYFALGLNNITLAELLELSERTVATLVLKLQRRLSRLVEDDLICIGGAGHIVQLDECCFGKRKYNVGRTGGHRWVFGGIDVETKEFFMRVVPNRTVNVLGELISDYVVPGSIVHTDEHRSYISFFSNNVYYSYQNVNHKTNFVNPDSGAQHRISRIFGASSKNSSAEEVIASTLTCNYTWMNF